MIPISRVVFMNQDIIPTIEGSKNRTISTPAQTSPRTSAYKAMGEEKKKSRSWEGQLSHFLCTSESHQLVHNNYNNMLTRCKVRRTSVTKAHSFLPHGSSPSQPSPWFPLWIPGREGKHVRDATTTTTCPYTRFRRLIGHSRQVLGAINYSAII